MRMQVSTDQIYYEEECPTAIEPLLDAIECDDRIGTADVPLSHSKRRAYAIIEIMYEWEAYSRSDTSEETVTGVTTPELDETGRFSTTQQTLRQDLKALDTYGYLERESTEPPYQFTIADDWVDVDIDVEATAAAVESPTDTNVDECISAEMSDDVESPVSPTNYQRVSTLATEAAANLTPAQRLVVAIFGRSGIIVGLGSGGVLVAGTQLSPHLVAAGESGLLASGTLLFGWLWLHFVGFVAGDTAGREERESPSETV